VNANSYNQQQDIKALLSLTNYSKTFNTYSTDTIEPLLLKIWKYHKNELMCPYKEKETTSFRISGVWVQGDGMASWFQDKDTYKIFNSEQTTS
jgi:hypothetical protein